MTVESFKQQYPEYSSLEGVALWDMMERAKLLQQALEEKDNDGPPEYEEFVLDGMHYTVDKKVLKFFQTERNVDPAVESYRMVILDFSNSDELVSIISEPPQAEVEKFSPQAHVDAGELFWNTQRVKLPEMDQETQKKFFDEMEKEFWWDRILNKLKK